ncbi:MAG: glycosyltransferase family 2 protein [Patescibacteria group bacterium]
MKLSFSIPAYNEEKNIWRCLDSIFQELKGKKYQVEIIVVDNNSTDRTAEIAKSYAGVRVVPETKKGLLYARERGYETATGDLIANVDADTILTPGWIDTVFQEFEENPNLVALSGPYVYYDLPPLVQMVTKFFYSFGYIVHRFNLLFGGNGTMLQGGNFVLRKTALDAIGGFNTDIAFYGEDTDIAVRMSTVGKIKFTYRLPMKTSGRRLAEEGVVTTGFRYAINHFWMLLFKKPFTVKYGDVRAPEKTT